MLTFFVVLMAYIVFVSIVNVFDQTRKFELYEKELNSKTIGQNEKIIGTMRRTCCFRVNGNFWQVCKKKKEAAERRKP